MKIALFLKLYGILLCGGREYLRDICVLGFGIKT